MSVFILDALRADNIDAIKQYITRENVNDYIISPYSKIPRRFLWSCCRYERKELIMWLIDDMGASVGVDEIRCAITVNYNDENCIQYLISKCRNIREISTVSGCSVLHYVMSPGVAKMLLRAGADYNAKNNDGETPFERSLITLVNCRDHESSVRMTEIICMLLDTGARLAGARFSVRTGIPEWIIRYQDQLDIMKKKCASAAACIMHCAWKRRGAPRDLIRSFLTRYVLCTRLNIAWLNSK